METINFQITEWSCKALLTTMSFISVQSYDVRK